MKAFAHWLLIAAFAASESPAAAQPLDYLGFTTETTKSTAPPGLTCYPASSLVCHLGPSEFDSLPLNDTLVGFSNTGKIMMVSLFFPPSKAQLAQSKLTTRFGPGKPTGIANELDWQFDDGHITISAGPDAEEASIEIWWRKNLPPVSPDTRP